MPRPKSSLSIEAIRLRVEGRKSLKEIAGILKVSISSVSLWLRGYPLTEAEIAERQKLNPRRTGQKKPRGEESKFHRAVDGQELTRQRKMKIAEAAVLFRLALHGFVVFGSPFDGDKTDWLAQYGDGEPVKVQVKWTRSNKGYGLPRISLVCTEGHNQTRRYEKGEFDFIVGYDLFTDTAYVISEEEASQHKTSTVISNEYAERWEKLRR